MLCCCQQHDATTVEDVSPLAFVVPLENDDVAAANGAGMVANRKLEDLPRPPDTELGVGASLPEERPTADDGGFALPLERPRKEVRVSMVTEDSGDNVREPQQSVSVWTSRPVQASKTSTSSVTSTSSSKGLLLSATHLWAKSVSWLDSTGSQSRQTEAGMSLEAVGGGHGLGLSKRVMTALLSLAFATALLVSMSTVVAWDKLEAAFSSQCLKDPTRDPKVDPAAELGPFWYAVLFPHQLGRLIFAMPFFATMRARKATGYRRFFGTIILLHLVSVMEFFMPAIGFLDALYPLVCFALTLQVGAPASAEGRSLFVMMWIPWGGVRGITIAFGGSTPAPSLTMGVALLWGFISMSFWLIRSRVAPSTVPHDSGISIAAGIILFATSMALGPTILNAVHKMPALIGLAAWLVCMLMFKAASLRMMELILPPAWHSSCMFPLLLAEDFVPTLLFVDGDELGTQFLISTCVLAAWEVIRDCPILRHQAMALTRGRAPGCLLKAAAPIGKCWSVCSTVFVAVVTAALTVVGFAAATEAVGEVLEDTAASDNIAGDPLAKREVWIPKLDHARHNMIAELVVAISLLATIPAHWALGKPSAFPVWNVVILAIAEVLTVLVSTTINGRMMRQRGWELPLLHSSRLAMFNIIFAIIVIVGATCAHLQFYELLRSLALAGCPSA